MTSIPQSFFFFFIEKNIFYLILSNVNSLLRQEDLGAWIYFGAGNDV